MHLLTKSLLFSLLASCLACTSQSTQEENVSLVEQKITPQTIGMEVSELANSLMVVFQDSKNNYWFGTKDQGAYKYDGRKIIRFTQQDGLPANRIRGIQEDKAGNLYFDTGEGISQFNGKTFKTLSPIKPGAPNNLWKNEADNLWFEGNWNENGVYRFDGQNLFQLELPYNELEKVARANNPNSTVNLYDVYDIYQDQKGILWFGTSVLGVCRFDGTTHTWISEDELTTLDNGPAPGIRSIVEDNQGNFWFSNVLYQYQVNTPSTDENPSIYKKLKGLTETQGYEKELTFFMSATQDILGHLWMVTYENGVWHYDGQQLVQYPVRSENKLVTLFSIYKDRQGILWLGTSNSGAYRFNGKSFERFLP